MKLLFFLFSASLLFGGFLNHSFSFGNDSVVSSVDAGARSIYTVCRIYMKNGEVKEGFISLLDGGYDHQTKSGFGRINPDTGEFEWKMFTLRDYSLECGSTYKVDPKTGFRIYPSYYFMAFRHMGTANSEFWYKEYYVDQPLVQSYYPECLEPEDYEPSMYGYHYYPIKEFYVYHTLPDYIYFPSPISNPKFLQEQTAGLERSAINVDDIFKFELVLEPSQKLLDEIERVREWQRGPHFEGADYFEPFWYHELRSNQRLGSDMLIDFSQNLGTEDSPLIN